MNENIVFMVLSKLNQMMVVKSNRHMKLLSKEKFHRYTHKSAVRLSQT